MPDNVATKESRATHAALLDIEAKAHAALKATASQPHSFADPIVASREIGARVMPVILAAKGAARRVGAQRMQSEVDATTRGQRVRLAHDEHKTTAAADRLAAERASREYSDALLREAQTIIAASDKAQASSLVSATDRALESIAVNEVASAFSDERRRLERAAKREYDGENWFPALLKMWDATLDRRTCPRCERLHGKMRPWGGDFAGHAEPPVHKQCRCLIVYVASPLFMGRSEAA
jgi:hypothetical protein